MKLADLVEALGLEVRTAKGRLDRQVTGGYASDLLSDVIANSNEGDVWITLQVHVNIVAVASMKEHAGIVLVGGREPMEDTIEKAESEGIPIMVSELRTFELAGRLHAMDLRARNSEKVGTP